MADASKANFIFATPKNWPGGNKWSTSKRALGEYARVEALDGHRLASWLRETPAVHYWLSERLGFKPRDARTLTDWWTSFRDGLTLKLPAAFFVAGRADATKSLVAQLTSAGDSPDALTVKASTDDEALAFIVGSLENTDLLASVLVVTDSAAWDRLVDSSSPLILIPRFEDPQIAKALSKGHRVLLLASDADVVRPGHIALPRIDPLTAGEAIDKATKNFDDGRRLVKLARRSMPAFLRSISRDPRAKAPAWVKDQHRADLVARLIMVSTWANHDSDHEAISELVSTPWLEIERALKALQTEGNPVYVPSGNSWQLGAPVETGQLLLGRLTSADLDAWNRITHAVLLEPDPYLGMDDTSRIQAQMDGVRPKYSSELRHGVALSLALASSSGVSIHGYGSLEDAVERIVRSVLNVAAEDPSGVAWQTVSEELPLLAEAAPNAFLDAVEMDLDQEHPLLAKLFQDQHSVSNAQSNSV